MDRKSLTFFVGIFIILFIASCSSKSGREHTVVQLQEKELTIETRNLLENLKEMSSQGFMFGHQDDPLYGVIWEGDSGRSDVESVVGDYPAVMGFDIGRIEHGSEKNIDNVSFDKIRQEIIRQYHRGGVVTISWHLDNPLTGGDSWDVAAGGVVTSILPGGEYHEKFITWLQRAADFLNSLATDEGVKIPILFRPWHEHTGSWFWWGKDHCMVDEYTQLWYITRDFFDQQGINHLLYRSAITKYSSPSGAEFGSSMT